MGFIVRRALSVETIARAVLGPDRGAVATFAGHVRNHQDGREVLRLEYSAYEPMAEAECRRIVEEASARWPVAVALEHRIGRLEIGDAAVVVAVSGGHRGEAFEACRWVIDEVKRRVPIWKREYYADGTESWVDPTASPLATGALTARAKEAE
ncbi:MAG TPA: molybdenum cofactor biosynthesis protein MoaE [Gemmatimonadales bacterium]|nr:molybdenum cofactor biosynthesis protein MoaE [Gemmatimonadales bacterium]